MLKWAARSEDQKNTKCRVNAQNHLKIIRMADSSATSNLTAR